MYWEWVLNADQCGHVLGYANQRWHFMKKVGWLTLLLPQARRAPPQCTQGLRGEPGGMKMKKVSNQNDHFKKPLHSPQAEDCPLSRMRSNTAACQRKACLNSFNSAVYHLVYHIYLLYLVWASAQAAGESGEGRTAAGWTPSASATSPGRPPSPCWLPWSGWPPLTVWLPLPFACSLLPFSREGGVGRLEHSAVPVSLCSTKLCLDGLETTL